MPDTLMLPFQRPSDAVIRLLRLLAHAPLLFIEMTDDQREVVMRLVDDKTGLVCETGVTREEFTIHLTDPGRLVLAACAADAPDPVGKVVEAARKVCSRSGKNLASLSVAVVEMRQAINALDAAKQGKGEGL